MKKILVCEDEDAIREFEVITLRRAGYEVVDVTVSANDVELEVAEWDGFYTVDVKEVADK